MTSNALSSEVRKGNAEQLFASPLTSYEILLGKLIGLEMYNLIFLILSFVILSIAAVFRTDIYLSDIAKIHIILLIYLYAFGALGILGSIIFKNFLYAAEMAYLVLAFLISDAVIIIPFIRWGFKASAMISLALHANPFTTVCSIINLDIFRTPYLYNLSPIASYGYTFPKWYLIALWYVLGLIGCFAIAVLKLRRET
jgi:ABC-2 type transport system permease protein